MDAVAHNSPLANMAEQDRNQQIETAWREKSPGLRAFVRRFLPGREDTEDLVQDVFAELTSGFDGLRDIEALGSWLFTVARNRLTDRSRKQRPITFSDRARTGEDGETYFLDEVLPSATNDPLQALHAEAIWEALEEALAELPPVQRRAFEAHELEGLSFRQLAEESGESVNTWLARKRYAVLHLRDKLQDLYNEQFD